MYTYEFVCVQVIDCLCASLSTEDKVLRAQKLSFLCGGISDEQVGHTFIVGNFCTLQNFVIFAD